ncbi:MAG: insulinase family protein [Gammaproteobacteria bacterium]|nr:insulinase family protein [Gammaproteobacteria bacterium]
MYRGRAVLAGILAAAGLAWAPALAATSPEEWRLDDGTGVVLVEDRRASWAYLAVDFPIGTWSPWARENPAREAFEIQLFDPSGALRRRADALGVALTVEMYNRNARIYGSGLAEDFASLADLMRSVLANRDFDRAELQRWRTLSNLEWDRSTREPAFMRHQAGLRSLFATGDPRRISYEPPRRVVTDPARLLDVRDAIVRLPGRTIAIAGRVARTEAERALAGLVPAAEPASEVLLTPDYLPLTASDGRTVTVEMPRLTQVYLAMVRHSIPYHDEDYPAYQVTAHVLGGHPYSRLASALRHDEGDTYDASATAPGSPVSGMFRVTTFTRTANAAEVERKMRTVIARLHREGITDAEFDDAVGYLAGRRLFARQTPADELGWLLQERRDGLPDGFFDRVADRASELGLAEVNAFVRRFLDPAAFTTVRVVSVGEAGSLLPP